MPVKFEAKSVFTFADSISSILKPWQFFTGKTARREQEEAKIASDLEKGFARMNPGFRGLLEKVNSTIFGINEPEGALLGKAYSDGAMIINTGVQGDTKWNEEAYHVAEFILFKNRPHLKEKANEATRAAFGDGMKLPAEHAERERFFTARELLNQGQSWIGKKNSFNYTEQQQKQNDFTETFYFEARADMLHVQKMLVEVEMLKLLAERFDEISQDKKNAPLIPTLREIKKALDDQKVYEVRGDEKKEQALFERDFKVLRKFPMKDRDNLIEKLSGSIGFEEAQEISQRANQRMAKVFGPLYDYYKDTVENQIPGFAGLENGSVKIDTFLITGRGFSQKTVETATGKAVTHELHDLTNAAGVPATEAKAKTKAIK